MWKRFFNNPDVELIKIISWNECYMTTMGTYSRAWFPIRIFKKEIWL